MATRQLPRRQPREGRRARAYISVAVIGVLALAGVAALGLRQRGVVPSSRYDDALVAGRQPISGLYSAVERLYPAPVLGVVVDSHLQIVAIEAGSAAEQAGLRPGDVITQLNGVAVTSVAASRDVVWRTAGQEVTVTATRGGQTINAPARPAPPQGQPRQPTPTPMPANLGYF